MVVIYHYEEPKHTLFYEFEFCPSVFPYVCLSNSSTLSTQINI